jgi:phage nucleotide-binding protein
LNQLLGLTDVVGRIMVNAKSGNRGVILECSEGTYAKNRLDGRTACPIEELFVFNV